MGNIIYKKEENDVDMSSSLNELINKIATDYIIKQNYSDMKQILDKNKYDEILDLVTTILSKNINTDDIESLVSQLYSNELNSHNTHLKKCRKIAVFYLKMAHLYDSIMMTINPHKNLDGVMSEDKGAIKHINMCNRRLNALINANIKLGKPNEIKIQSPSCHMDNKSHELLEEDGIPELETLYYDEYDIESGMFNKMSDKMKREYKKDVELFYRVFSNGSSEAASEANSENKSVLPDKFSNIRISDIITKDYDSICNSTNKYVYMNRRKKAYRMEKERLFKKYADNVKQMTIFIHKREKDLVYILNQVFVKDERTNEYNIHQHLHSYTLDKLIGDLRRIMVDFYSKCELFYLDGVQIYDAIVQNQIKYTTIKQIENSNVLLEKMMSDSDDVINSDEIMVEKVNVIENNRENEETDDEEDEEDEEYINYNEEDEVSEEDKPQNKNIDISLQLSDDIKSSAQMKSAQMKSAQMKSAQISNVNIDEQEQTPSKEQEPDYSEPDYSVNEGDREEERKEV